ncbi:MAG: trypsin-like serine protease [Phycisphaeraceae bacterium]|nr:trypsin-like serine protease [Phycisphaeraceae bacterium]
MFSGPAWGIVTSDDPDNHIVTPGSLVAGFNLDGVATIFTLDKVLPSIWYTKGSATLIEGLDGSKFVLTAAHLFNDMVSIGNVPITWYLPQGTIPVVSSTSFVSVYNYTIKTKLDQGTYDPIYDGYDVALIALTPEQQGYVQDVPTYKLGPRDPSGLQTWLGHPQVVVVGYGWGGWGATGGDEANYPFGTKRWGYNRYDFNTPFNSTSWRTQIAFDFDNNTDTNDFFGRNFGISDRGYDEDEVSTIYGDSGGPTFIVEEGVARIVGVHSYGDTFKDQPSPYVDTDVNTLIRGSWGEFAVDTLVTYDPIYTWIEKILKKPHTSQPQGSGPQSMDWDDGDTWAAGSPQSDEMPYLDSWSDSTLTIAGPGSINGPSTVTNIAGLFVGTGPGQKILDLAYGAEVNVDGDITIDTNGYVLLTDGDVTADNLVIQAAPPYIGPPDPLPGVFDWYDHSSATSLNVDRIIVNEYGVFFYDRGTPLSLAGTDYEVHGGVIETYDDAFYVTPGRSLTMTGGVIGEPVNLLPIAELRIQAGGTATVTDAVAPALILAQDVTLQGILQMDHGEVWVGDLTVESGAELKIGIGGEIPDTEFAHIVLFGGADLAGKLTLYLIDDFTPDLYTSFVLVGNPDEQSNLTVNGIFAQVGGVNINALDMAFAVRYGVANNQAVVITTAIPAMPISITQ